MEFIIETILYKLLKSNQIQFNTNLGSYTENLIYIKNYSIEDYSI